MKTIERNGEERGIKGVSAVLLGIGLAASALAGTGTTTADFLKITPDSRSAALGNTGSADPTNGFAAFHNPSLAAVAADPLRLAAGQTQWMLGSQISHAAASLRRTTPSGSWGFGFTFSRLSMESFKTTDRLGNQTGTSAYGATMAGISVSRSWNESFSAGVGVKKISEGFEGQANAGGSALAWDAGVFARGGTGRWRAGAVLQHAGAAAGLTNSSDPLPTTLRAGMEWVPGNGQFTWTLEAAQPKKETVGVSAGMGVKVMKNVSLRGGYDGRTAGKDYAGLTTGLGVAAGDFTIDYAFTPFGSLGNAQRISVTWAYGGVSREVRSRGTAWAGEIKRGRTGR